MLTTSKQKFSAPFILASATFALYLLSMPKTVVFEDDGLFILSSYFNGVSHPPGYPLHSLLGYVITHLPIANPATNLHALSALFSSLSVILIFYISLWLARHNKNRQLTAYTASIAYALSSTIWSQSIIAEVYTLNIFLFLSALLLTINIYTCSIKISTKTDTVKSISIHTQLFFLGLVSGLALSNHWPLFILGSLGLLFILIRHVKYSFKNITYNLVGLLLGLTPYIWLYLNSNTEPLISFSGPIDSMQEFYNFVSRKHFNNTLEFQATSTFLDKLNLSFYAAKQLVNQWGPVNSVFVPIGIYSIFKYSKIDKRILVGLLISFISSSILLGIIIGYEYNPQKISDLRPFLALSHSLGAIYFSFGIIFIINAVAKYYKKNAAVFILIISLSQTLSANITTNYRANDVWSTLYAKQLLSTLKPNSTLFVNGDINTGTLAYWTLIKRYRPDIKLINDGGLVLYGTRLFDPLVTPKREINDIIKKYTLQSQNPVYFITNKLNLGAVKYWLVYEYKSDLPQGDELLFALTATEQQYLHYIFSDVIFNDIPTQIHREHLQLRAVDHLLAALKLNLGKPIAKTIINYILKTTNTLNGLTYTLALSTQRKAVALFSSKATLISKGWELYEGERNKKTKAKFLNLLADIKIQSGDIKEANKLYARSLSVWSNISNTASIKLNTNQKLNHMD